MKKILSLTTLGFAASLFLWETFKVGLEKDELVVQIDKDKLQSSSSYEVSQR